MQISLAKLNHLLTVARLRNFSQAAKVLNISQPALSRSIASLEEIYGIRIFERSRSGVYATPQGKEFVAEAEALVRAANTFDHNAGIYRESDAGRISLGLSPMLASLILTPLARDTFHRRPRAKMHVSIKPAEALVEELNDQEIELFFCSSTPVVESETMSKKTIARLEVAFMVRPAHPLLAMPEPALGDLGCYSLACTSEEGISSVLKARSVFTCDNYAIMRDVALATNMVLLSPIANEACVDKERRLVNLRVKGLERMDSEIVLVRRRNHKLSDISQEIIAGVIDNLAHVCAASDPDA